MVITEDGDNMRNLHTAHNQTPTQCILSASDRRHLAKNRLCILIELAPLSKNANRRAASESARGVHRTHTRQIDEAPHKMQERPHSESLRPSTVTRRDGNAPKEASEPGPNAAWIA